MNNRPINVLIIEDNPDDARFIEEVLNDSLDTRFKVKHANYLEAGIAIASTSNLDIVILDLSLPDSSESDTLYKFHFQVPETPIVVLTGLVDEAIGRKAVHNGAQDYLVKGKFNLAMLEKTILYAIERNKMQLKTNQNRESQIHIREFEALEELTNMHKYQSGIPKTLDIRYPEIFHDMVDKFTALMEIVPAQRICKNIEVNTSGELSYMADRLGFVSAGTNDILKIYRTAMNNKTQGLTSIKEDVFAEEGSLLLLELMGFLLSHYQKKHIKFTDENKRFAVKGGL